MNKFLKVALFYIAMFLIIILGLKLIDINPVDNKIPVSMVYEYLKDEKIKNLTFKGRQITITTTQNQTYSTYLPNTLDYSFSKLIEEEVSKGKLTVNAYDGSANQSILSYASVILMVGFLIYLIFSANNKMHIGDSDSDGKMTSFGKSKAKLSKQENNKIKFSDVAGLDEEKEELSEIVDFLKNPKKYTDLGARIPKGILLIGPPGTGKTYISKAVAGEAGVPFFSISGSDFVEMFVGVGASRVRDLFNEAKKSSPCIIFIDEIDAVGRRRGAGFGGGHDEREQTLNQLLVEMDGFVINQGIIIIAATNRPDILDPALLRPGRFDRQIYISLPDIKGREEVIRTHIKNKPLDDDVNVKVLAKRTTGFTPADIENLLNESAIITARENKKKISMPTIEEAITKVIAGVAKKSRIRTPKDIKLTAYHEAGHAVLTKLLENTDKVHQVSITPRGRAGGFTMTLPEDDRYYVTKSQMEDELVHLLGGRVAESLVLDDISTGAQNDLQRVSEIARQMVTKYAFSENLSSMSYGDGSDEVFLGRDFATRRNYSEVVASQIDREIEKIVENAHERAKTLLSDNMDRLEYVAKALIKYETLDEKMFEKAYDMTLDITDDIDDTEEETKSENTVKNNVQYE